MANLEVPTQQDASMRQSSFSKGQMTPIVSATSVLPSQLMNKVSVKARAMLMTDPDVAENLRKSKLSISEMAAEIEERANLEIAK